MSWFTNLFASQRAGGDRTTSASPSPEQPKPAPAPETPSNTGVNVKDIDTSVVSIDRAFMGLIGTAMPRQNLDGLIGKKGMKIYADMRIDEQVKAVCTFKRDAILSRGWHFEFDKESKLSEEEQTFRIRIFEKIIEKKPGTFIDDLNIISVGREFGYSLTEKVYAPVEIDGKTWVGLNSLRGREPASFEFKTDPYGDLISCQQIAGGFRVDIDLAKFIHYVHNPEFDIYLGRSDLREAYRAWYFKEQLMKFWMLYMEKMSGGALVLSIGADSNIQSTNSDTYRALQKIAENFKAASGIVLPKGVTADLKFPTNSDAYDKAITWLDLAIARALLVPNLLGVSHTGQTGAYAQSQTQLEAFAWTLKADAERLQACLNEQLFYDLGEQNWGDGEYPCFKFKPNTGEQIKWMMTTFSDLISKGALVPTEDDEKRVRNILELPPRTADSKPLQNPAVATDQANKDHELNKMGKQHELGEAAKDSAVDRDIDAEKKKRAAFPEDYQKDDEEKPVTKKQMAAMLKEFAEGTGQVLKALEKFGYDPAGETSECKDCFDTVDLDFKSTHKVPKPDHKDWDDAEETSVPVESLIATQRYYNEENLENVDRDGSVQVMRDGDRNLLVDGHHRAILAKSDGQSRIKAKVLDAKKYQFSADWDESKHPRAPDGKFGEGGTEGGDSKAPFVNDFIKNHPHNDAREAFLRTVPTDKLQKALDLLSKHRINDDNAKLFKEMARKELRERADSEKNKFTVRNGSLRLTVSARDARISIASARERVDFAVIDEKQKLYGTRLAQSVGAVVASAVNKLLGDEEQLKALTDADTSDIANVDLSGVDRGRIKALWKNGLADAWALGRQMGSDELRRADRQRRFTKDAAHFASLKDKSIEYFENNAFRMAGNVSDGVRALIQQELQNSVKYGKTPKQTRETIWDRLTSKGFVSRDNVKEVEEDKGVLQGLDALWVDDEEQAAHYLDTLARTNLFESMNEARYGEFTDPALDGFVVALRYSAVLDDRTTAICEGLHDHVYEADSEIWDTYRPPNHFNCRSILVPITELDVQNGEWDGEISEEPDVEPQEGFK